MPCIDVRLLKENAGPIAEVLVALHALVAPPAEEGAAVAAGHLVAALRLLNGHSTHRTPLGRFLQIHKYCQEGPTIKAAALRLLHMQKQQQQ